jgi:hypothetical protein
MPAEGEPVLMGRSLFGIDSTEEKREPAIGERVNLYGYVLNNPVNLTDPSGLYAYGNFCGSAKKARCPPGTGPLKPIDAVDAACERHDCCIPTWKQCWKWTICSAQICSEVWDAYFGGCAQSHPGDKAKIDACKQAANDIGTLFCWQAPGVQPPEGGVSPG